MKRISFYLDWNMKNKIKYLAFIDNISMNELILKTLRFKLITERDKHV